MGFQLEKNRENWAKAAEDRGSHDVLIVGALAQLLALCPELRGKAKEDGSGAHLLPYWLVVWLAAPLHRVGDDALDAVRRLRLWEWLLDPEPLSDGSAAVLASEAFDKERKYSLAELRCAMVRARDLLIKSDSGAAVLFELAESAFFRAGRTRDGESHDETITRVESGEVVDEPQATKPTVFVEALYGHVLGDDGDLYSLSFLEVVLFPRFSMAQRQLQMNGFAFLLHRAGRSALAGLEVDWENPVELAWMSDVEICVTLFSHFSARMPPVALALAPSSVADARRLLCTLVSTDASVSRDVLSLSYLNVAGALCSLREGALARIYSGEKNGATLLVLLTALRDAAGNKSSAPLSLGDLYALQEVASTNHGRLQAFGLDTAEERHSKLLRLLADSRATVEDAPRTDSSSAPPPADSSATDLTSSAGFARLYTRALNAKIHSVTFVVPALPSPAAVHVGQAPSRASMPGRAPPQVTLTLSRARGRYYRPPGRGGCGDQ
jgi:hypothetical protein